MSERKLLSFDAKARQLGKRMQLVADLIVEVESGKQPFAMGDKFVVMTPETLKDRETAAVKRFAEKAQELVSTELHRNENENLVINCGAATDIGNNLSEAIDTLLKEETGE